MKGVGQGHLAIARPTNFLIEVSKGNVPGHSMFHKFGKGIVGTDIVPIASSLKYPTPLTAITLEVVSDSANDTALGTGARSVTVQGLDINWNEIEQTVPTNGLTPVPLPIDMLRVYRWWVESSGVYATASLGSHDGTITVQTSPGAELWFNGVTDPYPKGQSEIAGFSVKDDVRAYIFLNNISVDSSKTVDVMFVRRLNADTVTAPFSPMRVVADFVAVQGAFKGNQMEIPVDGVFPARTDLLWLAKVASGSASISISYDILIIKDGY